MMRKGSKTLALILFLGLARGCNPFSPYPLEANFPLATETMGDQEPGVSSSDSVAGPDARRLVQAAPVRPRRPALPAKIGDLPVPPGMEERVRLWELVYSAYDSHQIIFFHSDHPYIIYKVASDDPAERQVAIDRIRARLFTLDAITRNADDPVAEIMKRPNSPELLEVYRQFDAVPEPNRFLVATDRIGIRRGRKGELLQAYGRARPYLPLMERIFREEGLPPELTRLTFVESMFKRQAVSRKGAVGIWQFLASTATRYLVITQTVDERRDPVASTRAAARFLKENFYRFGSWPLAVTAYNCGPGRIQGAVRRTGSNRLTAILENEDEGFTYESENFYVQLLGVIQAERKLGLARLAPRDNLNPLEFDRVHLPAPYTVATLSRRLGINPELLIALNPVWTAAVEHSRIAIPRGYLLRVPRGSEESVRAALNLPAPALALEPALPSPDAQPPSFPAPEDLDP